MSLKHRQQKIQEKRKQTSGRDFVMEIGSWFALNFYRHSTMISKYPDTGRIQKVISARSFEDVRNEQIGLYNDDTDFFGNFMSFYQSVVFPNKLEAEVNENCDYADSHALCKNLYLTFCAVYNVENVCYSVHVKDNSTNVFDSVMVRDGSSNVYQSFGIIHSSQVFYSRFIYNSQHIWFSTNLLGCEECIDCHDLEYQKYCIKNKQYDMETYQQLKSNILAQKSDFGNRYHTLSTIGKNLASESIMGGSFCINSSNVQDGLYTYQLKGGKNCILVGGAGGDENIVDRMIAGSPYARNYYACCNVGGGENYYCCVDIHGSFDLYYCIFCVECSFCLGCIGLKNKSYCILNKQYSKEERYEKVDEIFTQMESEGTLGQFFPATINSFYFNDTVAYLIDPSFTKEEVTAKGYLWRDEAIKVDVPVGSTLVLTKDLDHYEKWIDDTWYIDPEILKVIIQDETGNVYRIVKMEYDFLVKHGLPLPRMHWLERMKENFRIS